MMGGGQGKNVRAAAWIALAALLAAGCSGGMPELPAMPSLGKLGAELPDLSAPAPEADKPKAEQALADIAELSKPGPLGDQVLGKAGAPVTIVQYISLSCPKCAAFQADVLPKLKKAYIDKGKVRLIVREYPIGHPAAAAAIVSRCVPAKDYFKTVDKFLLNQKDWAAQEVKKDEIYNVVKFTGLKRDKFESCLASNDINDALFEVKSRGKALGVAGTPTFFVNGRKLAGVASFEDMQAAIEGALGAPQGPLAPVKQSEAKESRPARS
jgi:protein-disulfide isomerase